MIDEIPRRYGQIDWRPSVVHQFVKFWNECGSAAEVAEKFDISAKWASSRASQLRRAGFNLRGNIRGGERAEFHTANRRRMTLLLVALCDRYDTRPDEVLGRSRRRDGRMDARKALAWAGHELMRLSWLSIMLFFERHGESHTTAMYWARSATEQHQAAAREAMAEIEADGEKNAN